MSEVLNWLQLLAILLLILLGGFIMRQLVDHFAKGVPEE